MYFTGSCNTVVTIYSGYHLLWLPFTVVTIYSGYHLLWLPFTVVRIYCGYHLQWLHLQWLPFIVVTIYSGYIYSGYHLQWLPFTVVTIPAAYSKGKQFESQQDLYILTLLGLKEHAGTICSKCSMVTLHSGSEVT